MVGVDSLSIENVQPGETITGLRIPADFDQLVKSAGSLLLEGLQSQHPEFKYDNPVETLYPPHSNATVAARFEPIAKLAKESECRATFVEPTKPADIYFVRNQHINLLSTLVTDSVFYTLESKIYLRKMRYGEGSIIQARKILGENVQAHDETRYAGFVAAKLRPRMRKLGFYTPAPGSTID